MSTFYRKNAATIENKEDFKYLVKMLDIAVLQNQKTLKKEERYGVFVACIFRLHLYPSFRFNILQVPLE